MDLQKTKEKVDEIAKAKNIHDQEIYNAILAFLETNYNYIVPTDDEKQIIEEVKNKVILTLYSKDKHRQGVNHHTNFNKLFDLDGIEIKFLERAFTELEADGQVSSVLYEIKLTEKGIMSARKL